MIQLRHCTVERAVSGCWTHFHDGTSYGAHPHDTHHYAVIAHRCGYGDDLLAYCTEHEVAHHFVAEKLRDRPSAVIWALAHGEVAPHADVIEEEAMALLMQRWARANEEPIIASVDWAGWKREFLDLLGSENEKDLSWEGVRVRAQRVARAAEMGRG